eukprot:3337080-Amphidinium_carterae.2
MHEEVIYRMLVEWETLKRTDCEWLVLAQDNGDDNTNFVAAIKRVYEEHNPDKLAEDIHVPNMIAKWKGKEEELYHRVCGKYGVSIEVSAGDAADALDADFPMHSVSCTCASRDPHEGHVVCRRRLASVAVLPVQSEDPVASPDYAALIKRIYQAVASALP